MMSCMPLTIKYGVRFFCMTTHESVETEYIHASLKGELCDQTRKTLTNQQKGQIQPFESSVVWTSCRMSYERSEARNVLETLRNLHQSC